MRRISIAGRLLQLSTEADGGHWIARAVRDDTGDPFGIAWVGATEDEAVARLTRWLEWQAEHAAALADLQQAERAYHRTVAGSAFASPTEGPSALEVQKESLDALERTRKRLDDVRGRQPE